MIFRDELTTAISVLNTMLAHPTLKDGHPTPRSFVYISAASGFPPVVPEGYIRAKREAESLILQKCTPATDVKPLIVRPGESPLALYCSSVAASELLYTTSLRQPCSRAPFGAGQNSLLPLIPIRAMVSLLVPSPRRQRSPLLILTASASQLTS